MFDQNPFEREELSTKDVCIIGCGSTGSAIAEMLVRAGVGGLALVDPEIFALEQLGRHLLSREDLGQPKVEAMRRRLLGINPECEITSYPLDFGTLVLRTFPDDNATDNLAQSPWQKMNLLVSTVDSFRCNSTVNTLSLRQEIPAVYLKCREHASSGEILSVIPGLTPCYECFAPYREQVDTRMSDHKGLWGNILVISGVAFQAILGLLGLPPGDVLEGRTRWVFNLDDPALPHFTLTQTSVKQGCAVCRELATEP